MPEKKSKSKIVAIAVILVIFTSITAAVVLTSFKKNNEADWQHRQSATGNISIQDGGGWYFSLGETINTWPKVIQEEYPVSITFGDGGKATIDVLIRYSTPVSEEGCKKFHTDFRNPDSVKRSMNAWVTSVMKSTGGIMSASEHAIGRKSEYSQMVLDQVKHGLYKKKTERITRLDANDDGGKKITVFKTSLALDKDQSPIVERLSSFTTYGVNILEVTLGKTDYDVQTLASFAKKKESLLKIEEIKARTQQEQEQGRGVVISARTMKESEIAKGEAEKARIEILASQARQKRLIEANAKKLEAEQIAMLRIIEANRDKQMAEIQAARKVEVAKLEKQSQIELANSQLEVAKIKAQREIDVAKLEKEAKIEHASAKLEVAKIYAESAKVEDQAIEVLVKAKEEKIKKAGALTERDRVLAEIAMKRDVEVAKHLANIKTPSVIFGASTGGNSNQTENLINYKLLKSTGILKNDKASDVK